MTKDEKLEKKINEIAERLSNFDFDKWKIEQQLELAKKDGLIASYVGDAGNE